MFNSWFNKQMGMYFAYHTNPYNCAFHFIGVPLIFLSVLIVLSSISIITIFDFNINIGNFLFFLLLLLYTFAIPFMGFVSIVVYFPLYLLSQNILIGSYGNMWLIALFCFVIGWVFQFIGHIIENRKPAFFDNLLQIFMAPGFLIIELLFSAGFCKGLALRIEKHSEQFKK